MYEIAFLAISYKNLSQENTAKDYSGNLPAKDLSDIIKNKYLKLSRRIKTETFQPLYNKTITKYDPKIYFYIDGEKDSEYATIKFENQKLNTTEFKIHMKDLAENTGSSKMCLLGNEYKVCKFFLPFTAHLRISVDPCIMKDYTYHKMQRIPAGQYFSLLDECDKLNMLNKISNTANDKDILHNAEKMIKYKKKTAIKICKLLNLIFPIEKDTI